jgi:hypothetical protein
MRWLGWHVGMRPDPDLDSYSLGRSNIVRQSTGDERTAGRSTAPKSPLYLGIDATSLLNPTLSLQDGEDAPNKAARERLIADLKESAPGTRERALYGIYGRPGKRPDAGKKRREEGDSRGVARPYRICARAPEGTRAGRQDGRLVVPGL